MKLTENIIIKVLGRRGRLKVDEFRVRHDLVKGKFFTKKNIITLFLQNKLYGRFILPKQIYGQIYSWKECNDAIFLKFKNINGKRRTCPFCGWRGKIFVTFHSKYNKIINNGCPKCGSFPRHRLQYFYLKKKLSNYKEINTLNIAPEKCMEKFLQSYKNIKYISCDIKAKAMLKEDITRLTFKEKQFDLIICNHVLEHILEDKKAIRELFRVLKKDGFAIIQVPISNTYKTQENIRFTEEQRERIYGLSDHVRYYGLDFKKRLEKAGFKVKVDKFANKLPKKYIDKYGLDSTEKIYVCKKD
jgi:hypothetical protein